MCTLGTNAVIFTGNCTMIINVVLQLDFVLAWNGTTIKTCLAIDQNTIDNPTAKYTCKTCLKVSLGVYNYF